MIIINFHSVSQIHIIKIALGYIDKWSVFQNLAAQLQQNNPNQHQNGTHDQAQ